MMFSMSKFSGEEEAETTWLLEPLPYHIELPTLTPTGGKPAEQNRHRNIAD